MEENQADQFLVWSPRCWRQDAVFIGAPAVVGPLFQHVAGIHNEAAVDARCVDPVAGIVEYLQTANTRLAIKNGDGAKVGVGANPDTALRPGLLG